MIPLLPLVAGLAARLKLRRCASVGRSPSVRGRLWIHGPGSVRLGDRVVLDASRGPIELHAKRGAEIVIGDGVRIEGGTSIEAVRSVVVGRGTVLGPFCKLLDNHFHPVTGDRSRLPESAPVWVGEKVVVGERSIVLPGARLEAGVRLQPGVVIGRRVPPGTVVAGSPPRAVRGEGAA